MRLLEATGWNIDAAAKLEFWITWGCTSAEMREMHKADRASEAGGWTIEGSARAHAPYTCTLIADSSRMMHDAVSALRRDGFSRIVVTESAPTSPPQAPKVRSPNRIGEVNE